MSGDDLAHAITDGRERYAAAKADQFGMGYASVNLGNWVLANLPAVLDAASRSLPPPAGQDERVRAASSWIRSRWCEVCNGGDCASANPPVTSCPKQADMQAADLLESLAARLAAVERALVYVAFGLHSTPQHMLIDGVTLINNDEVEVRIPGGVPVRARASRVGTTGEGTTGEGTESGANRAHPGSGDPKNIES